MTYFVQLLPMMLGNFTDEEIQELGCCNSLNYKKVNFEVFMEQFENKNKEIGHQKALT
jgi:hypothetical protein